MRSVVARQTGGLHGLGVCRVVRAASTDRLAAGGNQHNLNALLGNGVRNSQAAGSGANNYDIGFDGLGDLVVGNCFIGNFKSPFAKIGVGVQRA